MKKNQPFLPIFFKTPKYPAEVWIKLEDNRKMGKQKFIPISWLSEGFTETTRLQKYEKNKEGHFEFLSSSLNEGKCFVAKPLLEQPLLGFRLRSPQEGNPEPDTHVPAQVHPFPSLPGKSCVAAPLVWTISILMGLWSSLALVLLQAELCPSAPHLGTSPTRAGTGDLSCKTAALNGATRYMETPKISLKAASRHMVAAGRNFGIFHSSLLFW